MIASTARPAALAASRPAECPCVSKRTLRRFVGRPSMAGTVGGLGNPEGKYLVAFVVFHDHGPFVPCMTEHPIAVMHQFKRDRSGVVPSSFHVGEFGPVVVFEKCLIGN